MNRIIALFLFNFILIEILVIGFSQFKAIDVKKVLATQSQANVRVVSDIAPTLTFFPTPQVSNTPTPPESVQPSNPPPSPSCIIVIDSVKYDVTQFRNIHGGGDVFQCGGDMTADFYSRHDSSYLGVMAKYKL